MTARVETLERAKKEAKALNMMTEYWDKKGFCRMAKACYVEVISSVLDDIDTIKLLLKYGVNLKAFNNCAMKIAEEKGYKDTAKLLKNI